MKTAFITGIKGGIGKLLAKGFKDAGYFVIGQDKQPGESENCDLYYSFDLYDFAEKQDVREHYQNIWLTEIPRLDVLINNAATQLLGSLNEYSLALWNESLAVNLTVPFLLIQTFYNQLVASHGTVINIASIHHQLTKQRFFAYATTKSALIGLTKSLAVDVQGKFRINAISPAAIDTPMLHDGFNNDEAKVQQLNAIHPSLRIGKPQEVAKLALLLAEDELGFINGANLQIDGGISNVLKDLE